MNRLKNEEDFINSKKEINYKIFRPKAQFAQEFILNILRFKQPKIKYASY